MTEDSPTRTLPPIKIYTCHTPSHGGIFRDCFAATLPDSFSLHSTVIKARDSSDFGTVGFLEAVTDKLDLILASINDNHGSLIVWSDADIIFLTDPSEKIRNMAQARPDTEIWFQRETRKAAGDVNAGFVVMRCNGNVNSFYGAVLELMKENPGWNDQDAINHLLRGNSGVTWDYLPGEFYARSHGWPPMRGIALYHANCTVGADAVGQKIRQFQQFRRYQKYGFLYSVLLKTQRAGKKAFNALQKIVSRGS